MSHNPNSPHVGGSDASELQNLARDDDQPIPPAPRVKRRGASVLAISQQVYVARLPKLEIPAEPDSLTTTGSTEAAIE